MEANTCGVVHQQKTQLKKEPCKSEIMHYPSFFKFSFKCADSGNSLSGQEWNQHPVIRWEIEFGKPY